MARWKFTNLPYNDNAQLMLEEYRKTMDNLLGYHFSHIPLSEIVDVSIPSPDSNNLLIYSSSASQWTDSGSLYSWEDVNFSPVATAVGPSAPDLINFSTSGIKIASLDGVATNEELNAAVELPHKHRTGGDLIAHVHWCPTTTEAGNVRLYFDYWIVNGTTTIGNGTFDVVDSATGGAWLEKRKDFGTISSTGLMIGDQCVFRLHRIPTSTDDTYGSEIGIFSWGFHHEVDSLGSNTITSK